MEGLITSLIMEHITVTQVLQSSWIPTYGLPANHLPWPLVFGTTAVSIGLPVTSMAILQFSLPGLSNSLDP